MLGIGTYFARIFSDKTHAYLTIFFQEKVEKCQQLYIFVTLYQLLIFLN